MVKTCGICGATFEVVGKDWKRKYCSDECVREANKRRNTAWQTAKRVKNFSVTRICPTCGKSFVTTNGIKKFCSDRCRILSALHAYYRRQKAERTITKTCAYCGKPFTTSNAQKLYCSPLCQNRQKNGVREVTKTCAFCGKKFKTFHKEHKTCSAACRAEYRRLHDNAFRHVERVTRKCGWCGKEFETTANGKKICCSHQCRSLLNYWGSPDKRREAMIAKAAAAELARRKRTNGLTDDEMREVVRAQDGDQAQLYRLSQRWTDKQRKYAKERYMVRHGIKAGYCEF